MDRRQVPHRPTRLHMPDVRCSCAHARHTCCARHTSDKHTQVARFFAPQMQSVWTRMGISNVVLAPALQSNQNSDLTDEYEIINVASLIQPSFGHAMGAPTPDSGSEFEAALRSHALAMIDRTMKTLESQGRYLSPCSSPFLPPCPFFVPVSVRICTALRGPVPVSSIRLHGCLCRPLHPEDSSFVLVYRSNSVGDSALTLGSPQQHVRAAATSSAHVA